MIASGFTWFNVIAPLDHDVLGQAVGVESFNLTTTFAGACLSALLVILFAVLARMQLNARLAKPEHERFQTSEKLSILTLAELFATFIRNMMAGTLPRHEVKHYSPYISALFLYILFNNLQALIPGMLPPSDNINSNAGIAIASFLVFMWVGLSRDFAGFIKHLAGPSLFLVPLLFPIEVLSLLVRPVTLMVRLTANMFGDHKVYTVVSDLVPIVIPMPLLVLAAFVSLVQAFIFSLLSTVYIGMSLPHDDHH